MSAGTMNNKHMHSDADEEEAPSISHAAQEPHERCSLNYSPSWPGIAILALSTLASVLLVWQGRSYITRLEEQSAQLALRRLAFSEPAAICVGAMMGDVSGIVSDALYLRCDSHTANASATCPPVHRLQPHERNVTAAVFTALWECTAMSGFYLTEGLYGVLAGQYDTATLMADLTSEYRTGQRNFSRLAWFISKIGGPVGSSADPWSRTFVTGLDKYSLLSKFDIESECLPDLLHSYPGLLNGFWRIALGQQDFLFVALQQDSATAQCMHGALARAGVYPKLCPQAQSMYLTPLDTIFGEYAAYNCTNGVDIEYWDEWTIVQTATHGFFEARFLGFKGSFATILAIFTGTTASLFGAAVALVSHLVVAGAAYIPPPWRWPCWKPFSAGVGARCPGCLGLSLQAHRPGIQ